MKADLILAGVGGQGILTIARVVCEAALGRGLQFKQAEVHGMSQRGGSVQTHLRIDEQEVLSDLVAQGQADLLVAVEPLEALRYGNWLAPGGAVVSSSNPFINITDYPDLDEVLERVAGYERHVLIDSERIARGAGSVRAANVVMLGATSVFLDMPLEEIQGAIDRTFARAGDRIIEVNKKAFAMGRAAALAYREALGKGAASKAVLAWLASVEPMELNGEEPLVYEA